MREIKFRAWDKKNKKIYIQGENVYMDMQIINYILCPKDTEDYFGFNYKDYELMQYTGLNDKNGKEIFEGDIVVQEGYLWFDDGQPNYRGTVEWIYSQWQVVAHCVNPEKSGISDGINEGLNDEGFDEGESSEWEVIGNVYENPELLKGEVE